MQHITSIPKRFLPAMALSSALVAILAHSAQAGPLTSSKEAFDAQMKLIEGDGGSGVAAISGPLFALVVLLLVLFIVVTLGMAAFEGGGNLPLVERVKNVLLPAAFITVSLGIVGGLVTWVATI
jgi:hypothetical protein